MLNLSISAHDPLLINLTGEGDRDSAVQHPIWQPPQAWAACYSASHGVPSTEGQMKIAFDRASSRGGLGDWRAKRNFADYHESRH
jgi:hypothetical protein